MTAEAEAEAESTATADSRLVLYHIIPSRSAIVHWMLEEIGQPYRLEVLDAKNGAHKSPAYLAINPMGKVPALKHGEAVITEAAAICCYLADAFPEAGLAVPIGDPQRGAYLTWLFFGPSCLEPAVFDRMFPREAPASQLGWGSFEQTFDVLVNALRKGPYLLGERFSTADVVIGSDLYWCTMTGSIPENPVVADYVARLQERPALQRAVRQDSELAPESAGP